MIKSRPVRLTLLALLTLLLVTVGTAAGLLGLAYSERGTHFLATQAKRWTGDTVNWEALEGSLSGPLTLRELRFKQPGLQLDLDKVTLDWDPLLLARGRLQVTSLQAENMRVALANTASPPAAEPFSPASLRLPIDVNLQGVRLVNLQLTQNDQPAQLIERIDLAARLADGELSIQKLDVVAPQGSLRLTAHTVTADKTPLEMTVGWQLMASAIGAGTGTGTGASPGAQEPLTGELSVQGDIDWRDGIAFALDYRIEANGLQLVNPELPASVSAAGELRGAQVDDDLNLELFGLALDDTSLELTLAGHLRQPSTGEPTIDASLQWSGLQWPLVGLDPQLVSPTGSLQLAGSTSAYTLELSTDISGRDIPTSRWQGQASGDTNQLVLERFRGLVLGGELNVTGPLQWNPAPRWDLELQGSDLDPQQLAPDVPGKLAIDLRTSGQLHPDRGLLVDAELVRLSGTLLDYPLMLGGRIQLEGQTLQILALQLDSGGNQLTARGNASPDEVAIDWQLNAAQPGAFIPGADGALTGSGALRGSLESPRMQASLAGDSLQLEALAVQAIQAELQMGLAPGDTLELDLHIGPVSNNAQLLINSVRLQVSGTTSRHKLALNVDTAAESLLTRLEGGLTPDLAAWRGQLVQVEAQGDQFGHWHLDQPSTLALAASDIALGSTCLRMETGPGEICTRLEWTRSGGSTLHASAQALPLDIVAPDISGELAGELDASLAVDGKLRANASLQLSPGQVNLALDDTIRQLDYGGGELAAKIDENGLNGNLRLATPEQGNITAQLQLPGFTSLPLSERQPLSGRLQAALPDLAGLAAWVPELASTAGSLEADLQAAGTLDQPEITGVLSLLDGAADIPLAGLQLSGIELRATSSREQRGQIDIKGSLASGPGQATIAGQADLASRSLALEISGEQLQVYNTPDARALLSPNLAIGWSDDILKLRGQLTIPSADITPQLGLSPATQAEDPGAIATPGQLIAPSADVVVIHAVQDRPVEEVQPLAPFRIDSELQVTLGDEVRVNALGFISRITGEVIFTNAPDRMEMLPMAKGRLSVVDGTFRAFGQNLSIETGQLIFANVPANKPELNVRAVRWIDNDPEVTAAGIIATGPVTEPVLELFSRPQLETSEIQSYLLTGNSPRNRESVLSIGTYILPSVYVGYGYNLLEGTSEFNSLFSITPRYGVGSSLGEADNNINLTFTYEH